MDYIISDKLYKVLKWAGVIVSPALAEWRPSTDGEHWVKLG